MNGRTGDPFPGIGAIFPTQGTYITIPPNVSPTYMMQWNLSYQRQLAPNWVATVNYMGNASRHIWGSTDINYAIPLPGATTANTNQRRLTYLTNASQGQYYGGIQQTDDGANAEYHGLYLSLEHHFAKHYTILTNYTWSHCISSWDFTGELAGTQYQNPLNRAQGERGNCSWDHRHNFVTTMVLESPGFGQGWAKNLTKEWMLSPILNLYTGAPIQIVDGRDISLTGQGNDRPDVILPNQVLAAPQGSIAPYWFNPAAFQCAGSDPGCSVFSGRFGNLGRNALYGPGVITWDMNLTRQFQVTERWKIQFRADVFNVLNHANWNNPGSTVSSSATFGEVTSFYPYGETPQVIQMALKIYF